MELADTVARLMRPEVVQEKGRHVVGSSYTGFKLEVDHCYCKRDKSKEHTAGDGHATGCCRGCRVRCWWLDCGHGELRLTSHRTMDISSLPFVKLCETHRPTNMQTTSPSHQGTSPVPQLQIRSCYLLNTVLIPTSGIHHNESVLQSLPFCLWIRKSMKSSP
jgi:hypothetical protein